MITSCFDSFKRVGVFKEYTKLSVPITTCISVMQNVCFAYFLLKRNAKFQNFRAPEKFDLFCDDPNRR